jgi:hypothetical protein
LGQPERDGDVADGALFRTEILENLAAARFGDGVERVGCGRRTRHAPNHIPMREYVKPQTSRPASARASARQAARPVYWASSARGRFQSAERAVPTPRQLNATNLLSA